MFPIVGMLLSEIFENWNNVSVCQYSLMTLDHIPLGNLRVNSCALESSPYFLPKREYCSMTGSVVEYSVLYASNVMTLGFESLLVEFH